MQFLLSAALNAHETGIVPATTVIQRASRQEEAGNLVYYIVHLHRFSLVESIKSGIFFGFVFVFTIILLTEFVLDDFCLSSPCESLTCFFVFDLN